MAFPLNDVTVEENSRADSAWMIDAGGWHSEERDGAPIGTSPGRLAEQQVALPLCFGRFERGAVASIGV
ncbi:hypothetical protein [Antarcticirhabdus aurantiaca]|uniref:Uncharacterized protein n=1 Tax=Antarcticirhabdus aurantiaca TaxID=2606717 RepID=A0ACD4NRW0_9HYPH|nr:hypothetical protein [Antarcticirhabdus aurantiaca]WAJ29559.1 hypothetical protein OXU80_04810 [Jeongeuplla avenae]